MTPETKPKGCQLHPRKVEFKQSSNYDSVFVKANANTYTVNEIEIDGERFEPHDLESTTLECIEQIRRMFLSPERVVIETEE